MLSEELIDKAKGAYLGMAIGDALGATTEFMTPQEIQASLGVHRNLTGGGWLRLKPGQVTDDTQMALALGASILVQGQVDAAAVAESFSQWMKSKPVDIGNTVRRGISHFRTTGSVSVPESEHDAGNGACMRCLPVALAYLYASPSDVRAATRAQSHITHNNTLSDAGTQAVVEMVIAALHGSCKSSVLGLARQLASEHSLFAFEQKRMQNPSGYIVDTLRAVFQSLAAHDSFEDILVDVVNRGGDADTTGAICGMLAGALYGVEALPIHWLNALDADVRAACEHQAEGLILLGTSQLGMVRSVA